LQKKKKNQWPNEEMGKWTEQNFFKGRSPNGKKTEKEMLSIPGHKGNVNQNNVKIPPHSCSNSYHQEHQQQKCWRGYGEKHNPRTLLVGM
jgi:hypothetical protein